MRTFNCQLLVHIICLIPAYICHHQRNVTSTCIHRDVVDRLPLPVHCTQLNAEGTNAAHLCDVTEDRHADWLSLFKTRPARDGRGYASTCVSTTSVLSFVIVHCPTAAGRHIREIVSIGARGLLRTNCCDLIRSFDKSALPTSRIITDQGDGYGVGGTGKDGLPSRWVVSAQRYFRTYRSRTLVGISSTLSSPSTRRVLLTWNSDDVTTIRRQPARVVAIVTLEQRLRINRTVEKTKQNRVIMMSSLIVLCFLFSSSVVMATDLRQPSTLVAASSSLPTFVASSSPPPGYGPPVFVVEPDDVNYVVRGGRPVILTCGAWPAIQMTVQCAGQWIDPSRQVTGEMVDPRTGSRYLRTTVELSKDEIEQLTASSQGVGGPAAVAGSPGVGGGSQISGDVDYQCECHAWNNVPTFQSARSKKIYIRLAYMRKRFEQEPINTVAELSSNVQLQCHPPSGLPIPEVFWLKDGEMIDVHLDTNFIISNEGSLIINQARLSDSGNYSCGSQNMAGRRISESATLTVRVTGVWSPWSDWSECSAICSRGFQRRSRSCLYPSSSSVGRLDTEVPSAGHLGGPQQQVSVNVVPCQGDTNQRMPCASLCAVDGDWSVWSAWSSCGTDCRRYRRRVCDNPSPEHGGRHCQGLDLDTTGCVGTQDTSRCPDTGAVDVNKGTQLLIGTSDDEVFKYVGLALGCAVFVAAIGLVACFLRRFRPHNCQDAESKQSSALRQGLMIPDLTKTVIVVGDCSSSTKTCGHESPPQHDVTYDHVGDTPDTMVRWLPSNGDISAVAWSKIGQGGACLCLPELDVSLTIPEGSIVDRQLSEVFLTTSTADNSRPSLTDDQTLLCGVVICGPASLRLEKPAVLTFPHCASDVNNQWSWSVLYSDVTSGERSSWRLLDHTKPVPDICLQMEPDHCCIMTRMLGRYMLVGQPVVPRGTLCTSGVSAAKILRLAVFVPRVPASLDFNVRVYFVEDTPDALEGVLRVENQLGGSLIDKSRTIPFYLNGGNLHLSVEEVGPGWWLKQVNGYQEIPFRHIWNGTQSGLHCSFALEHVDAAGVGLNRWNRLNCDIVVCQTSLPTHRQLIRVSHDVTYSMTQQPASTLHYSGLQDDSCQSSRYVFVNQPRLLHARLSQSTRKLLNDALNRPNSQGLDWHALAHQIGFSRHINYFSTTSNPTERVIDLWESLRCDSRSSAQHAADLVSALRALGHGDLASCVQTRLSRPISTWS